MTTPDRDSNRTSGNTCLAAIRWALTPLAAGLGAAAGVLAGILSMGIYSVFFAILQRTRLPYGHTFPDPNGKYGGAMAAVAVAFFATLLTTGCASLLAPSRRVGVALFFGLPIVLWMLVLPFSVEPPPWWFRLPACAGAFTGMLMTIGTAMNR